MLKLKAGLGKKTNSFLKLVDLELSLKLANEKGSQKVHVFGDSLVIIKWMECSFSCENIVLHPLFEEVGASIM